MMLTVAVTLSGPNATVALSYWYAGLHGRAVVVVATTVYTCRLGAIQRAANVVERVPRLAFVTLMSSIRAAGGVSSSRISC